MLPDSTSALLLLSVLLVPSSALSCRTGTQRECDAAPFVPGHNLVGQSFDIVKVERKGVRVIDVKSYLRHRDSCILCTNPLQKHVLQKLPSTVVDWSASSQCNADIFSSYHTSVSPKPNPRLKDSTSYGDYSTSSLVKAYSTQDTNDWTFGLEIERFLIENFDVEGTNSSAYKFVSQKIKEDRHTFSLHSVTCSHYGFILSSTPPISLKFKKQIDNLPTHYNYSTKNEFEEFIYTYGTHYFRMVNLGGRLRRVTSSRSCLASLNGLTSSEVHSCLSVGVAVGLGKMKLSSVQKSCTSVLKNQDIATRFSSGLHQHFTEVSGGDGWLGKFSISQNDSKSYMKWLKSLKEHPGVVSHSLRPLYDLVPNKLQKEAVKAAIEQYLEDTAVKKLPEEPHCEGNIPDVASNCCPRHAYRGTLSVTIIRGWNLYGDDFSLTDGYAKMFYGSIQHRTRMIESNNPQWNARFNLGKVDASLALKIEVWDQDPKYDDLLVKCEHYLIPGTQSFTCRGQYGNVEVLYRLICDPYLTGGKCGQYKPSPL